MRTLRVSITGVGLVFAVVSLLSMASVADADVTVQSLYGIQYNAGSGLFAAIVAVATNEHIIDATLALPDGQILHPVQTWVYRNYVVFKFAVKGEPVQSPGDDIEAFISGNAGGAAHATATCAPYYSLFICR